MEEAQHYIDAGLIEEKINGRICLIRSDIDLDYIGRDGVTNRDRIKNGGSPLTRNGEEIHLHHIGQKQNSPLAELTKFEHLGKGNYSILHDTKKVLEIDRIEFAPERKKHWETRFNIGGQKNGYY